MKDSPEAESWETWSFRYWKPIFLAMASLFVIFDYYAGTAHEEVAGRGFIGYSLLILTIFGLRKFWQATSGKKEITYSPLEAVGWAVGHLSLVCAFFPMPTEGYGGASVVLFFKILGFLALPTAIVIGTWGFGSWLLKRILPDFETRSREFRTVASMATGLSTLVFTICLTTWLGGYNLATTLVPAAAMAMIAWREILGLAKASVSPAWRFENHRTGKTFSEFAALPLLSTEILFVVFTLLMSVNFVNVVRPMPIGWDDLGVYMNYPKIMAETGFAWRLGTVAWQLFTGIGFLFRSAPQAFFLNQVGGILTVIFITAALSKITSAEGNVKRYANLPFLFAILAYAMPMTVFQQAKDMKLDPALLAITTAAIFILYEAVFKKDWGKHSWRNFALAGFLTGVAFAIKATTLMLILGAFAMVSYVGLGLAGFYGFFALFVGAFTKFRLWDFLNVIYPKNDPELLLQVSLACFAAAVMLFGYAIHKNRATAVRRVGIPLAAFATFAGIGFAPWIGKNAVEILTYHEKLSIGTLLNGSPFPVPTEARKARSVEEIQAIDAKAAQEALAASSDGKTVNEDLGRYLGYEKGINNYLKLPFNLTYQRNQPGEYTEISFVFLAFLPAAFVFLRFSNPWLAFAPVAVFAFEVVYFWGSPEGSLTRFFSSVWLPIGYALIAFIILGPLAAFHIALKRNDVHNERFLANLAFLTFYGFIFVISAFGIVWYGIAVYVLMFIAMNLAFEKAVEDEGESHGTFGFATSVTVFAIVATYLFNSAVPHAWANMNKAGFEAFKAGKLNQEEAIFASHPDYLPILATLNLKDPLGVVREIVSKMPDEPSRKAIENYVGDLDATWSGSVAKKIETFNLVLGEMANLGASNSENIPPEIANRMAQTGIEARRSFYEAVLYPSPSQRNQATIYRIGTFLTYFISENRKRYLDDSLVMSFHDYVYDKNPEITVQRLKKLGVKYFLIDLNAATIDRDPRRALTKRFEELLLTFKSDKLSLVKTDSLCLETAIRDFRIDNDWDYIMLAGVNYETYTQTGVYLRKEKQRACGKYVGDIITGETVKQKEFEHLGNVLNYVNQVKPKTREELDAAVMRTFDHGWVALFEVK